MLNYFRRHATSRRLQQDAPANANPDYMNLVNLLDFNVQVARVSGAEGDLQSLYYDVTDVVSEWMNDSYESRLTSLGYQQSPDNPATAYAQFDSVILLLRSRRALLEEKEALSDTQQHSDRFFLRRLQDGQDGVKSQDSNATASDAPPSDSSSLLTAQFKGAAFFTKNATQVPVPPEVIQYIQQETFRNQTGLLHLLQASTAVGLGQAVVDVSAVLLAANGGDSSTSTTNDNNGQLTLIIYIAVAVAVVAFVFLLLAVCWAWRYDRRNRNSYLGRPKRRGDPSTSAESAPSTDSKKKSAAAAIAEPPVSEIGAYGRRIPYHDASVVSEDMDVSTSLSQYYRSSNNTSTLIPVRRSSSLNHAQQQQPFNDAASVSSMESYGYSLDGYASTIAHGASQDVPYTNSYGLDMDSVAQDDTDDDEHAGPLDL